MNLEVLMYYTKKNDLWKRVREVIMLGKSRSQVPLLEKEFMAMKMAMLMVTIIMVIIIAAGTFAVVKSALQQRNLDTN
jgi:hypothetical protein